MENRIIGPLTVEMQKQWDIYVEKNRPVDGLELLSYGVSINGEPKKLPQVRKHIIVSAGHSTKKGEDNGAQGNGYSEGHENARIRKRVVEILKSKYNVQAIIDEDFSELKKSIHTFTTLIKSKKYRESEVIAFEIHFNASANKDANGVETVIPSEYTESELKLAHEMSLAISDVMKIRLRGTTGGMKGVITEAYSRAKRLGWMRIPAQNVLLELCFITNEEEMNKYSKNFENICQTIAGVLYQNAI